MTGKCQNPLFDSAYCPPSLMTLVVCGVASAKLIASVIISQTDSLPAWVDTMIDTAVIMAFAGTICFFSSRGRPGRGLGRKCHDESRRGPGDAGLMNAVLNTALDGIIQIDAAGRVTGWNNQAEAIFGWSKADALHRRVSELIIPSRWRSAHDLAMTAASTEKRRNWPGRRFEVSALHRSGREFPVELTICSHGSAEAPGFIAFVRDLSEHNLVEDNHILATAVIEHSGEGIVITDASNRIVSVNPAFTEITGYAPEEVIGSDPKILSSGFHDTSFYEAIWSSIHSTGRWQGEVWNRRKTGEVYPEWLSIACCRCDKGYVSNYIAIFSDITARKVAEERMERLAYFDHLTGLPNRALLKDRLDQAVANARRNHKKIAVLFLDLDRFKSINDTHGHHIGDLLLTDVADRLRSGLREEDTVSRLGGDEFVVVLPDVADERHVKGVAEKLIDTMSQPFTIDDLAIRTGTSVGIAMFPQDGFSGGSLMKAADTAMYRAKQAGRGTCRFSGRHE